MSRADNLAVLAGIFCAGFLSMGFQLVGSRLLAPHFGSSIIVWAFLISTFLAAFSLGSFLGGWVSRFNARQRGVALWSLVGLGTGGFAFTSLYGKSFLRVVEAQVDGLTTGLLIACPALFFLPVLVLSALGPLATDILSRRALSAGMASGLVYGVSTLGNICGVMGTAFLLIPSFGISRLLVAWLLFAAACLLFLRRRLAAASRSG